MDNAEKQEFSFSEAVQQQMFWQPLDRLAPDVAQFSRLEGAESSSLRVI